MMNLWTAGFLLISCFALNGQSDRWQQRVFYQMDIDFKVDKHQFKGTQRLVYQNNSPDTLDRIFYHLYFNAFQPGSMMDIRSRTIEDPDFRVGSRIAALKPEEIGYHQIQRLHMNGKPCSFEVAGTILEVVLPDPILPHSSAVFDMQFESQVPVQIRRSGRDNVEGIDYSMAQWYPKVCEYDYQGWHANPYVAREFYGVWGDFDVKISIDRNYILAATGYLQNPDEIGYGYETEIGNFQRPNTKKLTWHFFAPNVHDFLWAADPDYTHDRLDREDGLTLHFFYQKNENTEGPWSRLPAAMDEAINFINQHYGPYPYQQYSFIQGGDGGMEYPMATLITANRSLGSLIGVCTHELMHAWYQGLMGTNEALYSWMDEGFTNWAETKVLENLKAKGLFPAKPKDFPHAQTIVGYRNYMSSGKAEPLTTHADHYLTNYAYGNASYTAGETFLEQLSYIIGSKALDKTLLRYYWEWRFKHPNANDFIRIAEKVSKMELDWFKEYFVQSVHTIDYGIKEVNITPKGTQIYLEKIGAFPMPIDLEITFTDGEKALVHIPLVIMRGQKPRENDQTTYQVAPDWPWTNPYYDLFIEGKEVKAIVIDPSKRLADIQPENNSWSKK